jgi:hypothetical protein
VVGAEALVSKPLPDGAVAMGFRPGCSGRGE